jgi:hypothetical protein
MTNSVGRWIAATFDFRFTGLASLGVVAIFILLKFRRDPGAVSTTSCLGLAFSVFTVISATNAGAVFLLTTPPAVDLLSRDSLALVGVVTVVAVYLQSGRDIIARFRSPGPPEDEQSSQTKRGNWDGRPRYARPGPKLGLARGVAWGDFIS